MRNALELVDVDSDRLEEVLRRAERSLDEKDAELIRAVFESYAYVTELVEDKNTTIRRLRQVFFGSRTEKTKAVVGPKTETSRVAASPDAGGRNRVGCRRGYRRSFGRGDRPEGSRPQWRRGLSRWRTDRRGAPVAACERRLSQLRPRHRLREGPGRASTDRRPAAAGGEGLPSAKAPALRRGYFVQSPQSP
jgi:hypothetical protein